MTIMREDSLSQNNIIDYKKRSQVNLIWKRFKKSRTAIFGLVIITLFILIAILADVIVDYKDGALYQDYENRLALPSSEHWFGTDNFGRDMFARVIHGTRVSFAVGFSSVFFATILGILIGSTSAYYGGFFDTILTRIMDAIMSIPSILLAIVIMAALGSGASNLAIAMAISSIPQFARLTRASVLSIIDVEYVLAAKAYGTSDLRIIFRHILPNAFGPIMVKSTMSVATVIITAAGLSFIGIGVSPPTPEWGTLLAENREFMRTNMNLVLFPGFVIVLSALSLNLLGDGLRDALDPKLKN